MVPDTQPGPQWVTMPGLHCPVSPLEEIACPHIRSAKKAAPGYLGSGEGWPGREISFSFLELRARTVASKGTKLILRDTDRLSFT